MLTEDPRNPYVIISSSYGQHEISKPLIDKQLNLEMPTARGLSMLKEGVEQGVTVTPIAITSTFAWEETTPEQERPTLEALFLHLTGRTLRDA